MDAGMGDYPLVLHGASSVPKDLVQEINKYGGKLGEDTAGVPEADIEIARRVGCTKVNIDTDLRLAMTAAIRKASGRKPQGIRPPQISRPRPRTGQGTGPPQSARRSLLRRPRLRLTAWRERSKMRARFSNPNLNLNLNLNPNESLLRP